MRINIFVNVPWSSTAYSNMARLFGPRLQALGHEISMTAMFGLAGGMLNWGGIPVYPRGVEKYSGDVQGAHAKHWRADVFMSWCDAFVVEPQRLHGLPWSPWCPIDGDPISPHLVDFLRAAKWPLVYSKWSVERAQDAGLEHVRYLPPGVETDLFVPRDKAEARERLGLPQDRYIVGMVQANIDKERKAQPQQLLAFAEFKKRHPDALLYIHTFKYDSMGGLDMVRLCESVGLVPGEDVIFAPQYEYMTGLISHDDLVNVYNSMDVLLAVTRAEGFGIPIVEAAACGVPAIVGGWSAMGELDFSGLAVPHDCTVKVWNNFETWWWLPEPDAIADSLELAHRIDWSQRRQALRQHAMAYDVDVIVKNYWQPLLYEMADELQVERLKVTA